MSDTNIFLDASNDQPQPALRDEEIECPTKVELRIYQPDLEGIDAPFEKRIAVDAIVEDEFDKDTTDRFYSEIKEQTNVILSNLYEQFTGRIIQEQQRGTLSSEQSVVLFNDWLLNFMSDQQRPYPIKCHFVSCPIAEYLEHVNATYGGLTKDQASIIRVLVNENNSKSGRSDDQIHLQLLHCWWCTSEDVKHT